MTKQRFDLLGHRVSVEFARGFLIGVAASLAISVLAIIFASIY
jgi:hypothetical protein